jgi:hypothetical protein
MPQFVQAFSNRCPVKPSFGFFSLRPRTSPEFEKYVDRKLFRTRAIFDHADNHPRDALILLAKRGLEIERLLPGLHAVHNVTWCVHNTITPAGGDL